MSARRTALALALALAFGGAAADPQADPFSAARQRDGWVNYSVPLAGDAAPCCWSSWRNGDRAGQRGCTLDRTQRNGIHGTAYGTISDGKRRAPGPKPSLEMFLLFERGEVQRLLAVGSDCPVDAGRKAVRTLEGVTPAASAALLTELAAAGRRDEDDDEDAWYALALHGEVGIDALLAVARDGRRAPAERRQALFWLAQSDDARAVAVIESILSR